MSGMIKGYNYDIFIFCTRKDNGCDHWGSDPVNVVNTVAILHS